MQRGSLASCRATVWLARDQTAANDASVSDPVSLTTMPCHAMLTLNVDHSIHAPWCKCLMLALRCNAPQCMPPCAGPWVPCPRGACHLVLTLGYHGGAHHLVLALGCHVPCLHLPSCQRPCQPPPARLCRAGMSAALARSAPGSATVTSSSSRTC